MSAPIDTAPVMDLTPPDLDKLIEAWRDSPAIYSPLWQRREPRDGAAKDLHGLRLEMPRKAIAPMILALDGANPNAVRALQPCISEGAWDDEGILPRHGREVDQELGEDDGVRTLDGSDVLTQGPASVGVKRQSGGEVGPRANGQAGGSLGDASRQGYTLLDRRLYVPQEGVEEEAYAERRRRGGVPADLTFKTKPTGGGQRRHAVHQAGTVRACWVTGDEAVGRDTSRLAHIDGRGLWSLAEGPHDTPVWRQRPATGVPVWSGQGRHPRRTRVRPGEAAPEAVAQLAASLPADRWVRRTIQEGRQGPLVAHGAALRVIAVREGLPGPEVWLVRRRHVLTGELKTSLSNAPADTPLTRVVRMSGMRWPIETCFEDGKPYVGMGDDEVRSWRGWHHHMTRWILAHFFLVRRCRRFKKKRQA